METLNIFNHTQCDSILILIITIMCINTHTLDVYLSFDIKFA